MAPQSFADRKSKILAGLNTPEDQYTDLSPKGSVDAGIRDLIAEINDSPDYVTTSSCAGRIAVYLEGSKGAKGGGKWLYTSHEPIEVPEGPGEVLQMFGVLGGAVQCATPSDAEKARFVHFKFEPMILHILSSSLKPAQRIMSAAMSAGFRESGINSILPHTSPQQTSPATPMVGVRSSGLAFDCIIGFSDTVIGGGDDSAGDTIVKPMVTEDYLRTLITVANQRFKTNVERTGRFKKALLGV
ncbi:hypothetical protein LTR78_007018 [Recurvomyces mirabilis]|uniref:tRNA(Phe) 7-[(3-amino-3-carboxypropyl)-4-demethylwyosine(37)-N(4)]-methyltransferase n=1 Tax=Recurvomyces mirabilis TaxID=574656 RepID=A0AAE1BZB3_9PEZI|nr:hypothetical protein LTR78_007018 [Recurvomyces mirabilis]KAK5153402.1 hypothetical protein LTS14_007571 [Recurvomyces mirabilis]